MTPFLLSLKIAGMATLIVFMIGVALAHWMARHQFFGKSFIEALVTLPLVLPPTVVGFGLLILFGKNGMIGKWLDDWFGVQVVFTWVAAVIASVVVSFPLMYQNAVAAFQQVDRRLESAALLMGASRLHVFRTITFPLAWPGLLAGLVLTFARALGEFGATLMLAGYIPGRTDTMPLAIYFAVESGHMDLAAFWAIIIVTFGLSIIMWLNWWSKKNIQRYTQQEGRG
ncbi:molybdate ABC transporter permease subunit [Rubeoparvulum massiliense]|uniref:molybdate ABC transporter permease subunit n=1 Tax=Rubeoparvulum massiliense TaxID=1631346 RepID=UPI00065E6CC3|nr:molybdate ABC transporter permease subunit [Rubeoparvulum massiliense]